MDLSEIRHGPAGRADPAAADPEHGAPYVPTTAPGARLPHCALRLHAGGGAAEGGALAMGVLLTDAELLCGCSRSSMHTAWQHLYTGKPQASQAPAARLSSGCPSMSSPSCTVDASVIAC